MPYSFASSTGSAHGTLDGLSNADRVDYSNISMISGTPDGESTRQDIFIRDTAKAYKFWGGNAKSPAKNVNSSYLANAFPDFSQAITTGSGSGSEFSVETGRAGTRQAQRASSRPVSSSNNLVAGRNSASIQRHRTNSADSGRAAKPMQPSPTNSSTFNLGRATAYKQHQRTNSTDSNRAAGAGQPAQNGPFPATTTARTTQRSPASSRGHKSPPRFHPGYYKPSPTPQAQPVTVSAPSSPIEAVPARLRYTLEPGYVPPHKWGMPGTNTDKYGNKLTVPAEKPEFFKKAEMTVTTLELPEQLADYVSGATQNETRGQRRALADIHARVVDETEASFIDEQPTLSRSRFQGVSGRTTAPTVSNKSVSPTGNAKPIARTLSTRDIYSDTSSIAPTPTTAPKQGLDTIAIANAPNSSANDVASTHLADAYKTYNASASTNLADVNKTYDAPAEDTFDIFRHVAQATEAVPNMNSAKTNSMKPLAGAGNSLPRMRSSSDNIHDMYGKLHALPIPKKPLDGDAKPPAHIRSSSDSTYDHYANITTKSFSMPEIPDISQILAPTYSSNSRFSNKPFNPFLKTNVQFTETHGPINSVDVPLDEKDLYLSIQALQIQVAQLKSEKKVREEVDQGFEKQIENLKNRIESTDRRNAELEHELLMSRAAAVQADKIKDDAATASRRIVQLEQEFASTKVEKAQSGRRNIELEQELQTTKASKSAIDRKIMELMEVNAKLRAENILISRQNREGEDKIDELEHLLSEADETKTELENQAKKAMEEVQICRENALVMEAQIRDLQSESYRALAQVAKLEEEKAKREESDSAFGDDDKSDIVSLKNKLRKATAQVHDAHQQLGGAAATIDTLQKEYLKLRQQLEEQSTHQPLQQYPQKSRSHVSEAVIDGVNGVEDDVYEDEPTLRPCQPPGVALRAVIARLENELLKEKERLAEAAKAYNEHAAGVGGRGRKALKERVEELLGSVEGKAEVLYDLHDVLEADL